MGITHGSGPLESGSTGPGSGFSVMPAVTPIISFSVDSGEGMETLQGN